MKVLNENNSLKVFGVTFSIGILSRFFLLLCCIALLKIIGVEKNLMEFFGSYCDAEHYMYIAEHGYQASGDAVNKIVFYPLLPLLMKIFSFVFRDYAVSGLVVSYISFGIATAYMYKLLKLDFDDEKTAEAILFLFIAPYGMFFQAVYTESLFLMLSLMSIYYARKEKWILSAVTGFFCALSKTQGMLLVVPVVYEFILCCVRDKRFDKKGIFMLLIPMGFAVYLCINKIVLGDFLAFQEYQAAAPFYNSAKWVSEGLSTSYGVGIENYSLSLILYWPQIILFFVSVTLVLFGIYKKVRTSYLAFLGVFVLVTYLQGWMISGARYVSSCFVMYVVMASIDNKLVKYFMYMISGMLCICLMTFWIQGYAIM